MKKTYTLEEMRRLAVGAYSQGYLSVYDPDSDIDLDDTESLDFLIDTYVDARSEDERRIYILS